MSRRELCERLFGSNTDKIERVAERAAREPSAPIVWEGDAATFQFTFVSANAESLLLYPAERWVNEATFWADTVIHPDDRLGAVAYCALATCKRADHEFRYRAVRADGQVLWLLDVVRVLVGSRGIAERLRGLMFDVTSERQADASAAGDPLRARPTKAELELIGD